MNSELVGTVMHEDKKCDDETNINLPIDHLSASIESKQSNEHRKKDSFVIKFLQRLSKPDINPKPKKHKKSKSKDKPLENGNIEISVSNEKSNTVTNNGNHRLFPRPKPFRKIFKHFGKRKEKDRHLSDSASYLGSRPSMSSSINTATNVACVGSCNDVNADRVCREEFEKYNSSSVDCILDYQAKKMLKDRESLSSTSEDLRDHEKKMNAPNTQIESKFSVDTKKSQNGEIKFSTAEDIRNIEMNGISSATDAVDLVHRPRQSLDEADIMLRKSNRPNDIQLRRSRVTSQSSIARSSLIMVAVSQYSPRVKCISIHATTPIGNLESPSYTVRKLDFEDENKMIKEEKGLNIVAEKNGNDFLKIVDKYEMEINAKIEIVQKYLDSSITEMNDDVIGQLHTTVGLAKLLLSEKFVQFRGLCHRNLNESDEHDFKTLCCDLEGYLLTLEIQIVDLEKKFQLVEKIRENAWQMPVESSLKTVNEVKKKKPKPKTSRVSSVDNQRSLEAKKRIAEYKKMCASKNQESTNLFIVE